MQRWLWCIALLVVALGSPAHALAQDLGHGHAHDAPAADLYDYVEGADRLEGQILAPCCWNQTLDIHGSEIANGLRREIRTRLRSGQSTETIQADLVKRYGEKILAVPPSSPLKSFAIGLSVAFGLAGVGSAWLLLRWRRRARAERAVGRQKAAQGLREGRDEWDDRLESELQRLE